MKSIKLLLFVFISLSFGVFAQDTLIKNTGELLTGIIIDQADGYISFQRPLGEEINLVAVDQLLLIKKANSEYQVLYKNDTLITKLGVVLTGKVLQISPDSVAYFRFNGRLESQKQVAISELLLIKFSNGSLENFIQNANNTKLSDGALYELGASDALIYYKTAPGVIVGEVLLGISSIMLYPMVAGITIACVKPNKVDNPLNPNNKLIYTEPEYKKGYTKQAKKRKTKDAFIAYFSGLAAMVTTLIVAFN